MDLYTEPSAPPVLDLPFWSDSPVREDRSTPEAPNFSGLRVAVIHYWLVNMRGGERVLEEILELFPQADLFAHVVDPSQISEAIKRHKIRTTFINSLPAARRQYSRYLPLMPLALEELDLSGYDLIISSESGPAKGVVPPPGAHHVCYCHSPMRYLWDQYPRYASELGFPARMVFRAVAHRMRQWDTLTASRVDTFVANSSFVAQRIRRYYGRPSTVVNPPVDLANFHPGTGPRGDHFLFVSELVGYKRADIAIDAANRLRLPLVVVGSGSEAARLRSRAGPTVTFKGRIGNDELADLYRSSRALIFPALEDFGIVPLEAMACGTPVIGYGRGGLRDSVVDGVTGLFFAEQTVESLCDAIEAFSARSFDPMRIAAHAQGFSPQLFRTKFARVVSETLALA